MIDHKDRVQIIKLLESHALFQTYRGRKQMFELAGINRLISQIDLEGSPFIVAGETVQMLESYGRDANGHLVLGLFLNTFKEFLGDQDEKRDIIEGILLRYDLMSPSKKSETAIAWKFKNSKDLNEKIFGENTLKHISFLQLGLETSKMVAFIMLSKWSGTGFMISPNLLLTNNHVIPDEKLLDESIFRFNYQLTKEGNEDSAIDYRPVKKGLFHTNVGLDYTIIEIENSPGLEWGYASFSKEIPQNETRINIIQHPAGLPKQISMQNNLIEYVDNKVIQYVTSTLPGSSGSPVLNDDWKVIAIHHAGGLLTEPQSGRTFFRNEGILIKSILDDLPEIFRKKLTME